MKAAIFRILIPIGVCRKMRRLSAAGAKKTITGTARYVICHLVPRIRAKIFHTQIRNGAITLMKLLSNANAMKTMYGTAHRASPANASKNRAKIFHMHTTAVHP